MIAELVGRIGRLKGQQSPEECGLTLAIKIPACSVSKPGAVHRCSACALTADTLGLVTDCGAVYAVQLKRQRYKCLDRLDMTGTAAASITRHSRQLYIGCTNGDIFCYDFGSNSRLARLPGHRTAITALSTNSDTGQLLSASTDAVFLWDLQTFRQRQMLSSAPYGSSVAAFSPSGNLLAAAAGAAGKVTVWHAKSLQEVCQLSVPCDQHQQPFIVSCLDMSLDEQWLAVGCRCPALVLVYSLQQQRLQHALYLSEEFYGIMQVQLFPDSTSAAVLSSTGSIHFLDLQSCGFTGQLQMTKLDCRATSFSTDPRANSMAVICNDGLIRLYDLATVRAQQQKRRSLSQQQVQKLSKHQLQRFDAGIACKRSKGTMDIDAGGTNQLKQHVEQVLAGVSNVPSKRKAAARTGQGRSCVSIGSITQVQQLDTTAASLNRQKLQQLLVVYGEFPTKYRQLVWEHLLQLPHNSSAFMLLQDRGIHPAYQHLAQQMPGGARSTVAVRLQACLSQLAHWCPIFGEVGFLPRFAFPFVKLCGARSESAFEMVASLLLNWCKGWLELYPNPPLPLLRRFLLLVSHHDLELGSHLQHLGVPLLQQLWHQMSGAMSDMLPSQSDWLVFWDHCLAAAAGPDFFYQLLCACLMAQRCLLLAVQDQQHLDQLWESRPAVDIHQVVKQAYRLQEATPEYAVLGLRSFTPLPPAADGTGYPTFAEYPAGSAELQAMERRRIQEAEEALIKRRQVVAELEQRSKQVVFDSAALTGQRQQLIALDAQRRAAMTAIDETLAVAGARLDDRSKEEKLKQIRLVEEAYQASLSSLRAEWSTELAALKADVEHKRRRAAAALKARQEEEDIKALEFQAQQRLWALQQEEMAAAGTSALQDAAATQTAALAAEQQRKAAEWQAEDDARALRQQHETVRRARLVAAAEQEAAKQAAKGLLLTQELQAQEELLKVEHQRRLRRLAEEEAELTAKQLQLQVERQAVLAAAGQEAVQQQAQGHIEWYTSEQHQRTSAVDQQLQALKQRQAELHAAAADISSAARTAAAEQQLARLEQAMDAASQEQQVHVQRILEELEQDRKAHDHTMSVLSALRAESGPGVRPAAAGGAGMWSSVGTAEPTARPSSSAASLEAHLATLTRNIRVHSAAAARQAAAYQPTAAEGENSRGIHGVTNLQEVLTSPGGQAGGRPADAAPGEGASRSADSNCKAQAVSQRSGRESADSVESLVRQVERLNAQHALRTAEAGSGAAAGQADANCCVGCMSAASSTTSSSSSVSQELEQLLAETEAEVPRELAYTTAAETTLTVTKQTRLQTAQTTQASSAAERLQPVLEEPSYSSSAMSTVAPAVATSAGRLPGSVAHSPAASPAASADGSPTRWPAPASSLAPRPSAGGKHIRPGSGLPASGGGGGSPAAVKLALSGLEPLTHHGRVMTGLADLLKRPPQATTSSSSGSSRSITYARQQQQREEFQQPPGAVLLSPETPSSTASMLTASSGSTATGSPAQARLTIAETAAMTTTAVLQPGAVLAQPGMSFVAGGSDYSTYEPVLLGVSQPPAAAAMGDPTAAGIAVTGSGSFTSSPSSTDKSSLQHSSSSRSLAATAAAISSADLHEHGERTSSRLEIRRRARPAGEEPETRSGSAAELEVSAVSHGSADSLLESRASSGCFHRGLDATGKVSAELRQSSSATSQELEDLLQQLAAYEERLLQADPSSNTAAGATAAEGASGMGTSLSSVSWSQTLAGLGGFVTQGDHGMSQ